MDFNQILLWISLGLLILIVLFALWGFLGGLKRELKCIAVFIVLLVLFWLVFGDEATLMNLKVGQEVAEILNIHDESITTVWDAVLAFARINIPNGKTLLVEGMETYELFSSLVATVFRAVGLMAGTLAVLILCPIIRFITHIIWLIVRGVKRSKAKKSKASVEQLETESEADDSTKTVTPAAEPGKEQPVQATTDAKASNDAKTSSDAKASNDAKTSTVTEVEQSNEQNNQPATKESSETKPADQVVIASNKTSADDAVITKDENEIPTKPTKRRWWGALAGALKGIFVIILVFAPVSGLCTILNTATPETQAMVSDLVNGDTKEKTANSSDDDAVSMAFDFADAYQNSAIGKFVESSGYFFGKSFSQSIFDNLLRVETKNQNFSLNDELINIVEAANELNGKSKVGSWTPEEIKNALEHLKQSKLLVEVMPVAIEYAYGIDDVKKLINDAGQGTKFLELRYNDWKKDLPILLDVVKEAYDLNIFPLDEFNYLTMDSQQLKEVVNELCKTDVISKIMPIAARIGLNMDAVKKYVGTSFYGVNFDTIDWKADLMTLTDIYEEFLKFEFKTLDDITKAKWNELVESIVDNEKKFNAAQNIVSKIAELNVYRAIGSLALQNVVEKIFTDHAAEFKGILELTGLTADEWKEDLLAVLDVVKAASEIKALEAVGKNPFNYKDLDLTSPKAIENYKLIVDKVLSLNVLGDDELKNKLVLASIRQFGWIDSKTSDGKDAVDLSKVDWENEKEVLMRLLDTYSKVVNLDGFDIYNLETLKFDELLNSEEFLDYVVDALEIAVDSEVFLQVLPGLINKYVIPKIESLKDLDDDTLVKDILHSVSSEELVNEIIKLVDVVKAALDIGVFKVNNEGIGAIDLSKTDALKDIVSGILGSKLIEGNEGRIIRVILKATGILDIEKDSDVYKELTTLDYTNEKNILLDFIDAIAPVLQDKEFKLVNDEGKINLDLKFWAENENAKTLLDGIEVLFGSYEEDTNGSNLITALLPVIYDKFVEEKNLIPDDFIEIVKELDVTNATGEVLAHDIKCLVYVLQQAVSVNAQSYLDEGNIEINEQLATTINNIIDALHDIELIRGHENATLAWGVNYVAKQLKIEVDAVNADFENVDWQGQKEVYKEIVTDLVNLLIKNEIKDVNQLKEVFEEIKAGKSKYVTDENVNELLNIVDKIADVQVIDAVLPLAIKAVVKILDEKGLALDYLNEFTSEELAEDFHTIVEMAHIAVDEGEFVKYYQNGFSEKLALPKEEVVQKIVSKALELHILADADGRLLSALYDKYVAPIKIGDDPMFLTSSDFKFDSIDWTKEEKVLHAIVTAFYDLSEVADFDTLGELIDMIEDKSFADRSFFTDEVGYVLVDLLRSLEDSQLVENVVVKVLNYAVDKVTETGKLPFSLDGLKDLKAENIMDAIPTVADVCDIAIEVGALEYVRTNDIAVINLDLIADLVEKLTESDSINKNVKNLIYDALKYAADSLNKSLKTNIVIVKSDVDAISIQDEGKVLASAIRSLKGVFAANRIVSLKNLLDFIEDEKYKKEAFFDANLGVVVSNLADSKYLQLFLPELFNYAIDQVKDVDLTDLKNSFTKEELASDVKLVGNALGQIKDAGFIGVVLGTKKVNELTIRVEKYAEIVTIVQDMNILNKKYSVVASALINKVLTEMKSEQVVTPEMFEGIQFSDEAPYIVAALLDSKDALAKAYLVKVQDVIDMTKDSKFYENKKYANIAVVYPLIDALEELANLQTLEAAMNVVTKVACEFAEKKDVNLDFLFKDVTNEQLVEDVKLALEYARGAVEFGALEYLTTKDIAQMDISIIADMVEGLGDFNIMKVNAPEAMSKLINIATKKLNEALKTNIQIAKEDVLAINFEEDCKVLADAIRVGEDVLKANKIVSLKNLLDFVEDKKYKNESFFNTKLGTFISHLVDSQYVQLFLPELFNYGIDQVKAIDLSGLKDCFTKEELASDVKLVCNALAQFKNDGLINVILGTKKINDLVINVENYAKIIDLVKDMNILNKKYSVIASALINKGLKEIKSEQTVTPEMFEGIQFKDEAPIFMEALLKSKDVLTNAKLVTVQDIIDMTKDSKFYENERYANESVVNPLIDVVEELANLQTLEAAMNVVAKVACEFAAKKDVNLDFLFKDVTNEQLVEDVKLAVDYARDAVEFGALEYLTTKDIAHMDVTIIADMVEGLNDFNVMKVNAPEAMSKLINVATKKLNEALKTNIQIAKEDVVAINFEEDCKVLADAIRSGESVLEANDLVSLKKLLDFVKDKNYKNESFFDANLGTFISNLVDSQYVQLFLPELFNYGIDQVKVVDLADLKDSFTKEELASDVKSVCGALEQIRDAGLISVAFGTKKVNELTLEVEKYAEIVESVQDMNILNKKYPVIASAVINKVLTEIKSEQSVTPERFEGIQFSDEAPVFKEALLKSKDFFANANLVTVQDVIDMTKESKFYENEKYANESVVYPLIDVVEELTNLQTLEVATDVVANVICEFTNKKNVNVEFLFKDVTNEQLLEDIKLAVDYARDAVEFGALEYLTTKDIAEMDLTIAARMVEGLSDFNIMQLHAPEVMQKLVDLVNKKVPQIRLHTTIEEFAGIDYDNEFAVLAEIVALGSDLMDAEVCHSLNDVLDIFKSKLYAQKGFFNETAFDVLMDMANKATELQSMEVIIPDLVLYAVKEAHARRIDMYFIIDDVYTPALQVEDLRTLISMVDTAYDFGLIDYVFDQEIENVDFDILNEVLDQAINLHVLDLFFANFLALGYNKAFKEMNMDIVVSKYEFEGIKLADEIEVLKNIIPEIDAFMDAKGYTSFSQLTNVFANKDYKYEAFYDVETGEVLSRVLSKVVDLQSVVVVLPYLLDFAVDKITKFDLTFLKGAFTKEELRNDIKGLANAIVPAIKAELVGLAFGKKVEDLNLHFVEYGQIVEAIKDLSLLNKKYPELASEFINKALAQMKSEQVVTPELFQGITFSEEAPILAKALTKMDEVVVNAGFVTVKDLNDALKEEKFYEKEQYTNEQVVYPLIDVLEELTNLRTLYAMMQVVANVVVESTDKKGFDSSFLFEGLTNDQLLADTKLALNYARDAVKLGGLEYLHTKDIANFDPLILADMVEGLYEFNVLHGNMIDVLDIIFTFVNTKVNGIYFDIDYQVLKDVDYNNEFAVIASAIREVKPFMDGLEYTSLKSLLNIVKNKDYLYENFYNETSYHAVTNAIRKLADSQIVGAMLPDVLDFVINEAYKKGYDLVFLKDAVYTTEFKLEDIKVVANILDKAYDFGAIEYVFNKDIPEINEVIVNEILAEVGKLHALDLFTPDLLALAFNELFKKAKMDIVVTRDDFVDVVIADEIPVFQNIVTEIKALMNEKGLVSALDVTDYINAKMYNNKEFFDVATGEILANIVRLSSSSEIVASLLPYLADYGIDKMNKIDLSVLKGAFTKEELASDLYDIADAIVPAIKAELVGLMFKESVKELPLHFEEYKEIITAIQDLNVINKKWPDLAPVLVNKVLESMKSNSKVSAEDFAGLTFVQDVPYLLQAIDELNVTCEKASVGKVQDIIDIINEKGYLLEKYANEEVVTPLLNTVEQVTLMANVEAFLPAMLTHLAEYLKTKKIDVAFLLEDLTKAELISDARLLVTYARDAVKLGVLEYVTTRNIAEFDPLFASDLVERLYEFNMMNHHAPEVMEKLMKIVNSKVQKLQFNITLEEFETIDYATEFKVLGEVIDYLAPVMEAQVMRSLKDVVGIVKDKLYKAESFYNDETVDTLLAMINKATELQTLKLALPDLVDYLVEFAKEKGYDIAFIQNEAYTVDYQIEDIRTLTVILDKAYDFGVVDYIFNKDIPEIDEVLLNEILEEAINLHILELFLPDVIALGVNKGFEKAKMDIVVTRDEFTEVVLADEVHALQDVVLVAKDLMNQKGLVSVQDILDLIKNKEYQNKEFFDEETGAILSDLVKELTDSEIVTVLLPKLFDYGMDKVSEKNENLDLTFLKGAFTKEELKSDVLTLADAIVPVIQANLVGLLFKEDVKQLVLEPAKYGEILDIIKDMHVLNKCWPMLASTLTNFVLDKMNSVQNVTVEDFAGLTFAQDVPTFIEAFNEYEVVLEKLNASTINDLTDIIKNKTYKDTTIANKDVATTILTAVEKTVDALNVQAILPAMLKHVTELLTVKGTEVDYLFAVTTDEQIIEDVYTLLATSQELVDYGMIEFALADGEIDLNDFSVINRAFETIMNLHMMRGNQPNVFVTILNKLKVETETIDLFDVEWKSETANMIDMLEAVRKLLVHFELNTVAKIKAFDYKDLVTINDEFNQVLDIYDEFLGYAAIDQVIPEIALPVAKRYFDTNNKELLGFHVIYNNSDEFMSDLASLQKIVRALRNLNLNGFLRCGMDYPFTDKENIETIISEVLGSYYLNNENRLDQILQFVDSKVAADLSGISTEGIDLRADIDEFILIFENFASITESKYWTLHKSGDKFNIALFGSSYALDHMLDMIDLYMDTTVYDQTGFAILIFAVPLIKVVAPNYYDALELDKVTVGMLDHDTPYIANIIRTLIDLDLGKVIENGSYFTEEVHQALTSILDDLFELEIGKGHGNAFFTELVNDLVNGKTVNGVEVPEGTIIFENTSLRNDREYIEQIIEEMYQFAERENIETMKEFNNFISGLSTNGNLKEFLSKDLNWTMMENIVSALNNMTFVEENGLSIMNQIVHPILEQKGSKFAKYVDLSDYTNELFVSDLDVLEELLVSLNHLGAASIIRDEEIAYEKVEDIQNIFVSLSELYYMESHMDQIIDALSRRSPFSLQALHSDDFAFANDMLTLSEAYPHLVPYLTSENNQFKTLSSITNFVKGGFKVTKALWNSATDYLYDFADAYDVLVDATALALLAPELVEFVKPKLPVKYQGLASVISFEGMSFAEVQADLRISSELLRNLIDFGIVEIVDTKDVPFTGMVHSTLLNEDVTRAEMINMMIENIRDMICLSNRTELVLEALKVLHVDTTTIDFSGVDWEAEFDNLKVVVTEGTAILESHNLHTTKEVANYIKSMNKANANTEMKRLVRTMKETIEHIAVLTETLDGSIAFNQLFKPLYNKYVFPQLPIDMHDLGNLEEYTIADLDEDMARLVVITNALKEMKALPGSVKDNATSDECIIPTQTIIEEFFALNLLDQKKQEIVRFIDKSSSQVDLSTLDVSNVDLANDGKTLAQYAAEILIVYKNMTGYSLHTADLANTELMAALITIYNGCVDTDTVQIIAHWVYDKYIAPIEQREHLVRRLETVDETVAQLTKEVGSILDAFLEMGVFSNNGIDFTNKAATDKLFGIFDNVYDITNPRMILVDMLREGFEELGVIPFSYENMLMNNEIKVLRDVFNLVKDFTKKHNSELKQNVFATLAKEAVQSEIDNIIARMFDSKIVKQIALPAMNGLTKIYTRDIYAITIFEGMTETEFRNTFMSDVYDIIEQMNELDVSGRHFDYTNIDGIIGLLDIIVNRAPFASHLEELFKYTLYILKVDVRDEYLGDIDWTTEYANFRLALQEMKDAMTGVDIGNSSTMQNNTFLSALAQALPHLNDSELLPIIARQTVEALLHKMDNSGKYNYYVNRMYESSYTDELLMKDYRLLPELLQAVVDLGYFEGGINYQELDPMIDLLETFFEIEFVKGDEVRYFNSMTKRVDLISEYEIDYTLVTDWEVEKVVLIDAMREFVAFTHLVDINNVTAEAFNDKAVQDQFVATIDAMSKSIIGQQLVPQLYADKIEPNLGHSDYEGVIDFNDPAFTPDRWAPEFEKFFEAYNLLQKYEYGSQNMTMVNADAIHLMETLFGTRRNKDAGIMTIANNPKLWLTRLYNNKVIPVPTNALIDSESERNWEDEPYRIMDVLEQMENFTTSEGIFTYDEVYSCDNEEQLHELLETVNNCVALRETILPIILNTMDESEVVTTALADAGLIDEEFDAVCDEWRVNGTYDVNYWTVERVEAFARVIAQANANA